MPQRGQYFISSLVGAEHAGQFFTALLPSPLAGPRLMSFNSIQALLASDSQVWFSIKNQQCDRRGMNMTSCEKCGAPASTAQRFCSECGASLAESNSTKSLNIGRESPNGEETTEAPQTCHKCGTPLEEAGRFCFECGEAVVSPKKVHKPEPIISPDVRSKKATGGAVAETIGALWGGSVGCGCGCFSLVIIFGFVLLLAALI